MDIVLKKMDYLMVEGMVVMTAILHRREGFSGQHLFVLPPSFIVQAQRHPLLAELFPTAAGYYPEALGHLVERHVGIPEFILIVCLTGRGLGGARIRSETSGAVRRGDRNSARDAARVWCR